MRTHSFCKDRTDGTDGTDGNDGLDGALVGMGLDERLLVPARTRATEQERHHWLAGHCKQGMNGTDGLDGALVGQGWDGRTLSGAGTGVPPLDLEGQRTMRSGSSNQFRRCIVFVSEKKNNTYRVHTNPNL